VSEKPAKLRGCIVPEFTIKGHATALTPLDRKDAVGIASVAYFVK